jgi:hypothetical protein
MHIKAATPSLIVALAAGFFAVSAFAQWTWVDKDGRKVYSDRSPPAEIKEKDILKRPRGAARTIVAPEPEAAASAPAVAKASAPKLSGKDPALEAKKKAADDEAAAKKKADEEKVAAAKAENCERAKRNLTTLQSGVRLAGTNAKGEREVYDDARRASETKRSQEIIDSTCK